MQRGVRAILAAALTLVAAAAHAASWTEVGDAGDELHPQATAGLGDLTEIHGTIGDPDFRDAFLFAWDGTPGALHVSAAYDDPLLGVLDLGLFDVAGSPVLPGTFFTGELIATDLPAALYVVGIFIDDDGPDPPYTIRFDGPGESGGAGFSSVPEPDTLALAGLGLCALAGFTSLPKNAPPRTRT